MHTTKWIMSACLFCSAAWGNGYLVVPYAQTSTPAFPDPLPVFTNKGFHQQELVGSGQFGSGPILINQIAFRAYPGSGPVNSTSPSLSLHLSTSPFYPNTNNGHTLISTTYADNIGPDNTLVYSGPVSFTSQGCAGPSACPFDMSIVFTTPFLYDPSQGQLLLDFQYASLTTVTGTLDLDGFQFPPGGSVANISGGTKSGFGNFAANGNILQIGYTLPSTTCDATGTGTYPCPIGGTVLLLNPPTGNLFDALGASGGNADISFIEDPQNPGVGLTSTNPLQVSGSAVPSPSEAFSFTTVSGQPAITGLSVSITCGVTGAGVYSLTISLPGGPLGLTCPTLSIPGATATVTGQISFAALSALPLTLTFSGSAPTANDSVTLSGFFFQLKIPSASSGCTYALDSGGHAFGPAAGGGIINITADPGCDWSVFDIPSWVVIVNETVGSGSGLLRYQVLANTGGDRSASLAIANLSFTIDQQAASLPNLTFVGSMAHIAAEENWNTEFTVVNKGTAPATARLTFLGDPSGALLLSLTFPQQPPASGPELAVSFDRLLAANASLIVDTAGPQTPPVQIGSANLTATGTLDGFAIFHWIPGAQEAVVPVETRNAPSYLLAFDNTGGVVLGVAMQNPTFQAANIGIVIRDDAGVQLATDSIPMPATGHMSFVLSTQYPVTANIRGTIEFDTPAGGRISVLGLRFTPPNNALTTIPVLANVSAGGGSIAHLASGGDGWQTTFVLVNTGPSAAQATLKFFADQTGAPLSLPLSFPQGGPDTVAPSVTQMLPAGAMLVIVSGGVTPQLFTGSAQLITAGRISGFVIFRHNNQEAVVPLESRHANAYILAFDNTNGMFTGLAMNAVSTQPAQVPVIVRDDTGAQIATDTLSLAPNGHTQFTLVTDKYAATANIRGTIEFDKPANAQIGVLGIRIPPTQTYTTLPALAK
jgi:hypothetical protein